MSLADQIVTTMATMSPAMYLGIIVAISVLVQWLAWSIRVPSILLLLPVGFGFGQIVSGEEVFGHVIFFDGVKLLVGIILFEGSLSLRLKQLTDLGTPVRRLCSRTVLIAWVLITMAARVVGFDWPVALLVGAILTVTGPTVINPILRQLRPVQRISSLLRWEGIVVDVIGTVLALLVFQGLVAQGGALAAVLAALGKTIGIGFGIGLGFGAVLEVLLRRRAVPDFLQGVVLLAAAVVGFVLSDAVQPQSGLLTVTILGIYLGNRPALHLEPVVEFTEHLQVLFVGALFIMLGGRVAPGELVDVAPKALAFLVLLIVVIRPASVFGGLLGTTVTRNEKFFLSGMAPRGVVAAAVTSLFALGLDDAASRFADRAAAATGVQKEALTAHADRLAAISAQTSQVVPLVFVVIVATVAVYGLTSSRLAERLGLASANPQGVVFVGASPWVVDAGRLLKESGIRVVVVARNWATLASARSAGLTTLTTNILSEFAVKDMDLSGIGHFIACTPEDEVNATAAREFTRVFGKAHTFQLHRDARSTRTGSDRKDVAGHLSARFAFQPALSRTALDQRMAAGMMVKRTTLTPKFTLTDFRRMYGPEAVILFVQRKAGTVEVATPNLKLPHDSGSLIAMVPTGTVRPDNGPRPERATGPGAGRIP